MENCGVRVPFDESGPPLITERVDLGGAFHTRQITRRHGRLHRPESTIFDGQNEIEQLRIIILAWISTILLSDDEITRRTLFSGCAPGLPSTCPQTSKHGKPHRSNKFQRSVLGPPLLRLLARICLSGCFSRPQGIAWRAAAALSENLPGIPVPQRHYPHYPTVPRLTGYISLAGRADPPGSNPRVRHGPQGG
jgi:hypothetical protein